jgi:hypothetical protein
MAVSCDWYSRTNSIVGMRCVGNWTIEECDAGYETLGQLVQPVTERFDLIVDFTEAAYTLPIGILWHWKQIVSINDVKFPDWGITVYVTQNEIYEAYLQEGMETSDIIRKHCRKAKTVEEAMQIIQQERHSAEV